MKRWIIVSFKYNSITDSQKWRNPEGFGGLGRTDGMGGPDAGKDKEEKPLGGAFSHTYAYDELNRLVKASGKAKGIGYAMDMGFGLMGEPLTKTQRTDSGSVAGSYALAYEYGDSHGLTIIGVEDAYQQTFTKYSKTPIVKSTRITGAVSSYSRQTTKNIKSRSGSKAGVKVSAILGVEIGIDFKKKIWNVVKNAF